MDRLNILIQVNINNILYQKLCIYFKVIAVSVEQLKQALNGLIMMSLELE
jgi:hypothetical protein